MIKHAILGTLQASLLLLLVATGMPQLQQASAQAPTTLGVDVEVDGNTPTSVASVQTCTSVEVGDTFPVDIYITDVEELRAWELRFAFDHQIVQLVDSDFGLFLLSTTPSGSKVTLFDMENADRYFLAAAEYRPVTPDSGSGVLARLTLEAVAPGRSPSAIVSEPWYFAPLLTDIDGNQRFDGPISQAEIAVGEPCSQPPPEPGTSPTPSAGTPTPGSTPPASQTTPAPSEGDGLPPSLSGLSDAPGPPPSADDGSSPDDALVLALGEDLPPSLSSLSDAPAAAPGEGQPDAEATPDSDRTIESDTTPVSEEGSAGEGGATAAAGGFSVPLEGDGSGGPPLWLFVPLGLLGLAAFTGGLLAIWSMMEPGRRG